MSHYVLKKSFVLLAALAFYFTVDKTRAQKGYYIPPDLQTKTQPIKKTQPKSGSQVFTPPKSVVNYQFRTGGLIVVDVYDRAHQANHAAIEYYVIPSEKPPQLNPAVSSNGQIQVTASGLKWETQIVDSSHRFQIKSPQCEITYGEDTGSAFRSPENFAIKYCKSKIVIAAGFGQNESPRHAASFGKNKLTVSFGPDENDKCQVLAEGLFKKEGGDFILKSENDIESILAKTETCAAGFAKFNNAAKTSVKHSTTAGESALEAPKSPVKPAQSAR